MCLILFAWKCHPRYHLIVAANRDEFFKRPSAPLSFWKEHPGVLAGKDLKAGGTWLGLNESGRFTAITNYRDLSNIKEHAPSRGALTLDYLTGSSSAKDYLSEIAAVGHHYNGFNLVVGDLRELFYYSNVENNIQKLEPGIYGLSNDLLDTDWPKVKRGRQVFRSLLTEDEIEPGDLMDLLADEEMAANEDLPDTGVPVNWERALSAIHINIDDYGTVNSTVLLASPTSFYLKERSYNKPQGISDDKEFRARWSSVIRV